MADSILKRLKAPAKSLQELQQAVQKGGDDVVQRSAQWKKEFGERTSVMAGTLRDASLTRIYGVGATTLERAAQWGDAVPVLGGQAAKLRESAQALEGARQDVQRPPIADYDELNVKQVNQALEGLSTYELEKVRSYEAANKDRVTVLRAVDSLLG